MRDSYKHHPDQAPPDWDTRQIKWQASFLQSSQWGDFQRRLGNKVHFLEDEDWSCLSIERQTPFGKYWFAPYGPTLEKSADIKACLATLRSDAGRAGASWLCLEPLMPGQDSQKTTLALAESGASEVRYREPNLTRVLDLDPPSDEILSGISQSTRSFIRKNQREGLLSFESSRDPNDIGLFIKMLRHVSNRNKVFFFSDEYFQKQAEALMPKGMLRLEVALKDKQPLACALFHDYGETTTYTYAASLPKARETSASALLLWQAILNAKARGIKKMDLFGVAPDDSSPNNPWYGFSSFKRKFGGEVISHAGTWDLPLSPKYHIYRSAQKLRRLGR